MWLMRLNFVSEVGLYFCVDVGFTLKIYFFPCENLISS